MIASESVAVVAYGAVSALGEGAEAASAGTVGEPARVAIREDAELVAGGFARPFVARARVAMGEDEDRATRLLIMSLVDCVRELDATRADWRSKRIGLALGTSSGGMRTAERFFARIARGEPVDRDLAARAAYFGPLLDAVAAMEPRLELAPATLVLCACASSVIAIGLAKRWLALGECDLALAGGFDAVSPFVASGFETLQATSARVPPRPFRIGRDGMALGEAAAVLALVRADGASAGRRPRGYVLGFGASADAVHITAPDRTGAGLARAARAAMGEAGDPRVDLLSAHATATPFNDAAESRGIAIALGDVGAREVTVHAFKAQVGHTLGAAGALETLACFDAMERSVLPATAGDGALDPDAPARILQTTQATRGGSPRVALKLASAFGGANAALVLGRDPPPARTASVALPPRDAWLTRAARVTTTPEITALAQAIGAVPDRLARADAHVLLALAAIAELEARLGGRAAFEGAGIVVGTAVATLETNARYASRLRDRGPRFVEPRRFPYTSPNAVAGECGVAFGLRGPSFSVGAGLHAGVEALVVASQLVRAGDAPRMVVVAVDEIGEVARAWGEAVGAPVAHGAVALLVTADRMSARSVARVVSASTSLGRAPSPGFPRENEGPPGHLALVPLEAETPPAHVESASCLAGTIARARVELAPS